MNFRSIHIRLLLWHSLLVLLVLMAFAAFTYQDVQNRLYGQMQATLTRRIERIRDDILPADAADPARLRAELADIYAPEDSNRFIRVSRGDRTPLYVSGLPRNRSFDPQRIGYAATYASKADSRFEGSGDGRLLVTSLETQLNGTGYLIDMGAPVLHMDNALNKLLTTLSIGIPLVLAAVVLGGSFLIRRALQPVEAIRTTAERISFDDPGARLPVAPTGDAIENLSLTLNRMLERLDRAFQQASRFSADASHELRTPLTILRNELESLMQQPGLAPELEYRLGGVLEETERLSRITEGLFAMARLDGGEARKVNEILDLSALAATTADQMRLLADEKNLTLTLDTGYPVHVAGDQARLKQVIVNLLDNACKYTPPGGKITLRTALVNGRAVLTLQDNGVGIAAADLPHIFERFYQADKTGAGSGAGLGLAIVRAIVETHGGQVCAESDNGGTLLKVVFPAAHVPQGGA